VVTNGCCDFAMVCRPDVEAPALFIARRNLTSHALAPHLIFELSSGTVLGL
jgi:hypothetical protein